MGTAFRSVSRNELPQRLKALTEKTDFIAAMEAPRHPKASFQQTAKPRPFKPPFQNKRRSEFSATSAMGPLPFQGGPPKPNAKC
jgi:hypothetical protein